MRWTEPSDGAAIAEALQRSPSDRPVFFTGRGGAANEEEDTTPERSGIDPGLRRLEGMGLSTARLDAVIEHRPDDLTIRVGAGVRMQALHLYLAERGQWIPVDDLALGRSVGGWVAAGSSGAFDSAYGGVRRHLLACEVVSRKGRPTRWGRPVMKNVAGYDLPKVITGGRGRTGVITEATIRVWPLPVERRVYMLRVEDSAGVRASNELDSRARGLDTKLERVAGDLACVSPVDGFEPDFVTWTAAGGRRSRLSVGLCGSPPSVEARRERLAAWVENSGYELSVVEEQPNALPPASSARTARLRPLSTRSVRLASESVRYGELIAHARHTLDRHAVKGYRLAGYPLGATLYCDYELDPHAAEPTTDAYRLLTDLLSTPFRTRACVERGGPVEHELIDGRRPAGVRALEERVVAALDGGRREWAADFL